MLNKKVKLGFIPANRGFFSDKLAAKMRSDTIKVLRAAGAAVVVPSPKQTKVGCVESVEEAILVGNMFREPQVDGIVVNCVNFGDEKGVGITITESPPRSPVLLVRRPHALAMVIQFKVQLAGVVEMAVSHRDKCNLDRCQPHRKGTAIVLNERGQKALHATQYRAVHHSY